MHMHMIALSYNSAKIQHLKTVVDELMRLYGVMNGSSWKFILNWEDCERRHQMRTVNDVIRCVVRNGIRIYRIGIVTTVMAWYHYHAMTVVTTTSPSQSTDDEKPWRHHVRCLTRHESDRLHDDTAHPSRLATKDRDSLSSAHMRRSR